LAPALRQSVEDNLGKVTLNKIEQRLAKKPHDQVNFNMYVTKLLSYLATVFIRIIREPEQNSSNDSTQEKIFNLEQIAEKSMKKKDFKKIVAKYDSVSHDLNFENAERIFGKKKSMELQNVFEDYKNHQRSIEKLKQFNSGSDEFHLLTFLLLMIYQEIPDAALQEISMLNSEMIEIVDDLQSFSRINDESKKFDYDE
jgi:hypothetical protein